MARSRSTSKRSQALQDLDLARELIELATDHRLFHGLPVSLSLIPSGIGTVEGHQRALADAQMIIDDVRHRYGYGPGDHVDIQSFYDDPRN